MDISQDLIIDAALNAAGYITAALLSIVFYSIFFRRNNSRIDRAQSAQETIIPAAKTKSNCPAGSGEFIKLGSDNTLPDSHSSPRPTMSPNGSLQAGKRDLSSIVAIAVKMLKAGAGVDKIMNVLPISEAELSLLKQSQKI